MKEEIALLLRRVPRSYQSWGYVVTLDYKKDALDAQRLVKSPKANIASITSMLIKIKRWYLK